MNGYITLGGEYRDPSPQNPPLSLDGDTVVMAPLWIDGTGEPVSHLGHVTPTTIYYKSYIRWTDQVTYLTRLRTQKHGII